MLFRGKQLLALGSMVSLTYAAPGSTFTTWDCCKPACAWSNLLPPTVLGTPKVCDVNNRALTGNLDQYKSGCETGGQAFLCADYSPIPFTDDLSYGFAVRKDYGNCCKCFALTWTSGAAKGKKMIVQIHNSVETTYGPGATDQDFIIAMPGGGSGVNELGCRAQYGSTWGDPSGGVKTREECETLPQNLQGGCYWRFNWALGDINGLSIDYEQTTCPSVLTDISGCIA